MFALEIDFHDGISPPETILVRRSNAIIGSSDLAHVVVEGAMSSLCELRLIRGLGREFTCVPVRRPGQSSVPSPFLEGTYPGEAELRLGELSFHVTSLDSDLNLVPDEFPDRAAVRILRTALTESSPLFPAVAVLGAKPIFMSFPPTNPLLIGRSRKCGLRLDASDISSEHARVGLDSDRCWVEDLGSTNGTFVGEERVSGRRMLEKGETINIGLEFTLVPVMNRDEVVRLNSQSTQYPDPGLVHSYPCIVSNNEAVRPLRLAVKPGVKVTIGRDPSNDIWISSPHISRSHVELRWDGEGTVTVVDHSSNGTYLDGSKLPKATPTPLVRGLKVLDLCSGVLLAFCCSEDDEKHFQEQGPSPEVNSDSTSQENTDSGPPSEQSDDYLEDLEIEADIYQETNSTEDTAFDLPDFSEPPPNVFEQLVQRSVNRAQESDKAASEEEEYSVHDDFGAIQNQEPTSRSPEVGGWEEELSDFEKYQRSQNKGDAVQGEFESDYNLLAEAEFDEELLEGSQFGGVSRVATFLLVIVLAFVFVFLILNMYSSGVF